MPNDKEPLLDLYTQFNPKLKLADSYEEFKSVMKDESARKDFFDTFNNDLKLADNFNEFEDVLGLKKKDQSKPYVFGGEKPKLGYTASEILEKASTSKYPSKSVLDTPISVEKPSSTAVKPAFKEDGIFFDATPMGVLKRAEFQASQSPKEVSKREKGVKEDGANYYDRGVVYPKSQYVNYDGTMLKKDDQSASWLNAPLYAGNVLLNKSSELASGTLGILRDINVILGIDPEQVVDDISQDPYGVAIKKLDQLKHESDAMKEQRGLPNNMAGNASEKIIESIPAIIALGITKNAKYAESLIGMTFSPLTKYTMTEGFLKGYQEAKEKGYDFGAALPEALMGGEKGFESGLLLSTELGLGEILGKSHIDQIVNNGLLIGGKPTAALIKANAVGTVFGATDIIKQLASDEPVDLEKSVEEYLVGLGFEIPHIVWSGYTSARDGVGSYRLKKSIEGTMKADNQVHNFFDTPIEDVQAVSDMDGNSKDYQTQSLISGGKAIESKDINERKDLFSHQLLTQKIADIKGMIDKISKDPEGAIKAIDEMDVSEDTKNYFKDMVWETHDYNQPENIAKRKYNNILKDIDNKIQEVNQKIETATEPIDKIAAEEELKKLEAARKENENELRKLVVLNNENNGSIRNTIGNKNKVKPTNTGGEGVPTPTTGVEQTPTDGTGVQKPITTDSKQKGLGEVKTTQAEVTTPKITEEEKNTINTEAKDKYGFDNAEHARGAVKLYLGKEYASYKEIPESELEQAAKLSKESRQAKSAGAAKTSLIKKVINDIKDIFTTKDTKVMKDFNAKIEKAFKDKDVDEGLRKQLTNFIGGIKTLVDQGTSIVDSIKASRKYLDQIVDSGEITKDQADEISNIVSEAFTPKTEAKGSLAEAIGKSTTINNADFKSKSVNEYQAIKDVFKAYFDGIKLGTKEAKAAAKEKINELKEGFRDKLKELASKKKDAKQLVNNLNDTFKDALRESGVDANKFIKYFGKITNINNLNNALLEVDKAVEKKEYLQDAQRVKDAYKALSKLMKKDIPVGDKSVISKNILNSIIKPKDSRDVTQLATMLEDIIGGLKTGTNKISREDISKFFDEERAFVEKKIAEAEAEKEREKFIEVTSEYEKLKTLGQLPPFVESLNDYKKYLEIENAENLNEKLLNEQERKQLDDMSRREKLAAEASMNFVVNVEPKKSEIFANTDEGGRRIYNAIKDGDMSRLNANELVMLNNGLDNLANYGDFGGLGNIATKMDKNKSLDEMPSFKKKELGDFAKKVKSFTNWIDALSLGEKKTIAGVRKTIIGHWENRIPFIKTQHDRVTEGVDNIIVKNKLKSQDSIDLGVYSFLNDYDPNAKEQDQKELVKNIIEQTESLYAKTFDEAITEGRAFRKMQYERDKSEKTAAALKKFGIVDGYEIKDNKLVFDKGWDKKTPDIDGIKLSKGQQELYDFMQNSIGVLSDKVIENIRRYRNEDVQRTENYNPRQPVFYATQTPTELNDPFDTVKSRFISKTQFGRAKGRAENLLSPTDGYYDMDVFHTFSQGHFENLMMAEAAYEYSYMANLINDNSGVIIDKLGESFYRAMLNAQDGQIPYIIKTDNNHGTLPRNYKSNLRKVGDAVVKNTIEAVLKNYNQAFKQTIPSWVNMYSSAPKATFITHKIMTTGDAATKAAIRKILMKSTISHRVLQGEKFLEKTYLNIEDNELLSKLSKASEKIKSAMGGNVLEYTDNIVSQQAFITGYVKYLLDEGIVKSEKDLDLVKEAKRPNRNALAFAETFASRINSESSHAYKGQALREDRVGIAYLLQSFNVNAHQAALSAARSLGSDKTDAITKADNAKILLGYLTNIATFSLLSNYIVDKEKKMVGDLLFTANKGEPSKKGFVFPKLAKEKNKDDKTMYSLGADILSNMALGSAPLYVSAPAKFAADYGWQAYQDNKREEFKKEFMLINDGKSPSEKDYPESLNKYWSPITMSDTKGAGGVLGIITSQLGRTIKEGVKYEGLTKEEKELYPFYANNAIKLALLSGGFGSAYTAFNTYSSVTSEQRRALSEQFAESKAGKINLTQLQDVMSKDLPNLTPKERNDVMFVFGKDGYTAVSDIPETDLANKLMVDNSIVYVPTEEAAKEILKVREDLVKKMSPVYNNKAIIELGASKALDNGSITEEQYDNMMERLNSGDDLTSDVSLISDVQIERQKVKERTRQMLSNAAILSVIGSDLNNTTKNSKVKIYNVTIRK
jgi:hypothetical protein